MLASTVICSEIVTFPGISEDFLYMFRKISFHTAAFCPIMTPFSGMPGNVFNNGLVDSHESILLS